MARWRITRVTYFLVALGLVFVGLGAAAILAGGMISFFGIMLIPMGFCGIVVAFYDLGDAKLSEVQYWGTAASEIRQLRYDEEERARKAS